MNTPTLSFPKTLTTSAAIFPSSKTHHHLQPIKLALIRTRSSSSSSSNNTARDAGDANSSTPPAAPSDTVQIKFRRGAKRKSRQKQENSFDNNGMPKKAEVQAVKKNWGSMTLTQKAWELYIGEKGLLFWLNKFAYASIFIVIGAWILFRFVGPALNLYQLDAPPLAPTDAFKGS